MLMRIGLHLLLLAVCAGAPGHASAITREELHLPAPGVSDAPMRIRVYLPPDYATTQARYEVLYVNDGQDMEAVGLVDTLERLYARYAIARIIVVAIDMPPDRMAGYGLFDRTTATAIAAPTRHGQVGANAHAYAGWLVQELVPAIDARYRTLARADGRAFLGWSLGALSAFGIGWQYPDVFGRIGAFSPSLWVASDNRNPGTVQATRIAHALVAGSAPMQRPKVFFGVGTREETDDRDGDGVIDVLDDTRDLIVGWRAPDGRLRKGLRGVATPPGNPALGVPVHGDAKLFLLERGEHHPRAWAQMLPVFLQWAYGRAGIPSRP